MITIKAISFLHKGERIVVKANNSGRFRVPVTDVIDGRMKTSFKMLKAREVIEHAIIKSCDPTLYLDKGERLRVYQDGDPSYLPAQVEGVLEKHDSKIKFSSLKKIKKSKIFSQDAPSDSPYSGSGSGMGWFDLFDGVDDYYD